MLLALDLLLVDELAARRERAVLRAQYAAASGPTGWRRGAAAAGSPRPAARDLQAATEAFAASASARS